MNGIWQPKCVFATSANLSSATQQLHFALSEMTTKCLSICCMQAFWLTMHGTSPNVKARKLAACDLDQHRRLLCNLTAALNPNLWIMPHTFLLVHWSSAAKGFHN